MKYRLARSALRDLAQIGQYTRTTWGEEQARNYRDALKARFVWLTRNKSVWRRREEIGEGLYTYSEASHLIVFREYSYGIDILRVLHGRMDLRRHV